MGQILSFTVESFDAAHPDGHRLADFQRLDPAIRAAKIALDDKRVTLAVVKDRDGVMVYAVDKRRDWTEGGEAID